MNRPSPASPAPLVAILGPTASGKSALSVFLAERFGGEILACDSTQVYRGFDIGTAKPAAAERRGIPHHLLDLVEPSDLFTAGEYRRRAELVLADLQSRGRLPILTVGTGLYLRALLEGLADAPERSAELRARLEARAAACGPAYLHRILAHLDPQSARRIAPRDRQKLVRAIEICVLAGKSVTELHRSGRDPLIGFAPIRIGLNPPRAELRARIERRTHGMLAREWLDEVAELIRAGVPAQSKPFEFIGYRALREHLESRTSLADATAVIVQSTRRYAKRQLTWFRREPDVAWLAGFGDDPEIADAAERLIAARLVAFRAGAAEVSSHRPTAVHPRADV
ncbi:MAG: tRNA (adenosine(37)-N6)-dimethylallyltransferase MiaA [Candidatus Acidiferrales bacterium]